MHVREFQICDGSACYFYLIIQENEHSMKTSCMIFTINTLSCGRGRAKHNLRSKQPPLRSNNNHVLAQPRCSVRLWPPKSCLIRMITVKNTAYMLISSPPFDPNLPTRWLTIPSWPQFSVAALRRLITLPCACAASLCAFNSSTTISRAVIDNPARMEISRCYRPNEKNITKKYHSLLSGKEFGLKFAWRWQHFIDKLAFVNCSTMHSKNEDYL